MAFYHWYLYHFFIRGLSNRFSLSLSNFWIDLHKKIVLVLIPGMSKAKLIAEQWYERFSHDDLSEYQDTWICDKILFQELEWKRPTLKLNFINGVNRNDLNVAIGRFFRAIDCVDNDDGVFRHPKSMVCPFDVKKRKIWFYFMSKNIICDFANERRVWWWCKNSQTSVRTCIKCNNQRPCFTKSQNRHSCRWNIFSEYHRQWFQCAIAAKIDSVSQWTRFLDEYSPTIFFTPMSTGQMVYLVKLCYKWGASSYTKFL